MVFHIHAPLKKYDVSPMSSQPHLSSRRGYGVLTANHRRSRLGGSQWDSWLYTVSLVSGGFCTHLEERASVLLYFKAPLSRHPQRLQIEKAGEFSQNMLVKALYNHFSKNVVDYNTFSLGSCVLGDSRATNLCQNLFASHSVSALSYVNVT